MSGGIQQQRQMVEQLRREAANKRAPLTQTIEDIKVSSVTFLFWWYDGKDPESFRDLCKNIAVRTSCFMDSRGRMPILTGLFILKASTILMKKTIWQFFPEKSPPAWCYKFFHQNAETFRHNVLSITVMDRFHIELVECLPDGNKLTSLCNHGCWYECLDPIPFWVWEILSLHANSLRIINWIFRAARVNQKAYQNLVNCYKDLLQE